MIRAARILLGVLIACVLPAVSADAADEASLLITGKVAPVCRVEIGGEKAATLSGIDLSQSGRGAVEVGVLCNVPLKGIITAEHGGLVNMQARAAGYVGGVDEIEYTVEVEFPTLGVFGPFDSDSLVAGQQFDTGNTVIFEATGTLRLEYQVAGQLYPGTYSETLRLKVVPIE